MQIPINEELAEEIGWHIGDGSMNYYPKREGKTRGIYQLRGHIEDDRPHYIKRIKPLFEKVYRAKINLREMPSTRVFGFQIWNNEIVRFKEQLGLPLGKKWELQIPEAFTKNKKMLTACIRGIFDTDGGLYLQKKNSKLYPRIYIGTISVKLVDQLTYLCNKLSLRATKSIEDYAKKGNRVTSYRLEIRGVDMLNKFFREISPRNQKHIEKYNLFLESTKDLKKGYG